MQNRFHFGTIVRSICFSLLVVSSAVGQFASDKELSEFLDELNAIKKRRVECLVDSAGVPKRVLITKNGVSLFDKPERDAKIVRDLGLYDRLFVYHEGDGDFYRVGVDPFNEGRTGYVPKAFCLEWNSNEMLFLNHDSVDPSVNKIYVWDSLDDAKTGDTTKAIAEQNSSGHTTGKYGDVLFPVLQRDDTKQFYEIGYVLGGDQGQLDRYGQKLTDREKQQRAARAGEVNLVLVIDATGSMGEYIAEVKSQATTIMDTLESRLGLKSLRDGEELDIKVRFGVVAYRDRDSGSGFDAEVFVPLTGDRKVVDAGLRDLQAIAGGDTPELVVEGVQLALDEMSLPDAAINRIILIGDAPPKELEEKIFSDLGSAVKGKNAQLDALMCGEFAATKHSFDAIATASGGKVHALATAEDLANKIVGEAAERLGVVPGELESLEAAADEGISLREAYESRLGATGRAARTLHKFLVARGAAVEDSGFVRTGWVKVRPGSKAALKIHVYTPRWKLARDLSALMGAAHGIGRGGKGVAELAPRFLEGVFGLAAGDKATAGMSAGAGETLEDRTPSLPETTPALDGGARRVEIMNSKNKEKIYALTDIWVDPKRWEHQYVWVPLELLP